MRQAPWLCRFAIALAVSMAGSGPVQGQAPQPDLFVNVRGAQDTPAGGYFNIFVQVSNNGTSAATAAFLKVTFNPASAVAVFSCGGPQFECTDGTATFALGQMGPGQKVGTIITGRLADTASGIVSMTASVSAVAADGSPLGDSNPDDNSQSVSFQVLPPAVDLFVGFGPAASGYYANALVAPGGSASVTFNLGNIGPSAAANPALTITAPWIGSCSTSADGSCAIDASGARAVFPTLVVGAAGTPTRSVTIGMPVPSTAAPGSEINGWVEVSADNPDNDPQNNRAAFNLRVQAPQTDALSVSTAALDFGRVPFGFNSRTLSATVTNVSNTAITLEAPFATSEFYTVSDTCFFGYVPPGSQGIITLAPGASCTTDIMTNPYTRGVHTGQLVYTQLNPPGQRSVALTVTSTALLVSPDVDFELIPVGTTATRSTYLYNVGPRPVHVSSITLSGAAFSQTNDCPPDLPASQLGQVIEACAIAVTYSPTAPGPAGGTITIVDDDAVGQTVVPVSGRAAALTMSSPGSPFSPGSGHLDFGNHVLDIPVTKSITVTNVTPVKTNLQSIVLSGDGDFSQKNDCPASLKPGESCTIEAVFTPTTLGGRQGQIAIADRETGVPAIVSLAGESFGIGARRQLFLHYDYMVLPDQGTMCTPGPTNPGFTPTSPDCNAGQYCLDSVCRGHSHEPPKEAIDGVIAAFSRRGVDLKIDPVSAPIPESRYLEIDSPIPGCRFNGHSLYASESAYFFDLKAKYYKPSSPHKQEHYAIFGHDGYTGFSGCQLVTGVSPGIPAYDFMVTLGSLFDFDQSGTEPDGVAHVTAGTLMHEFGHNLGLEHPAPNYNPAQFSVMNYQYQFGIPVADRAGSTVIDPARTSIDFSAQVLPVGGNTPGALTATDLNEPAGLGSGDARAMYYYDAQGRIDVAPSDGPVDWDGDGVADNLHADDPFLFWRSSDPFSPPITTGKGYDEWSYLFTGDAHYGVPGTYPDHGVTRHEQSIDDAMAHHVLMIPHTVQIAIQPGCTVTPTPIAPDQEGQLRVALLGSSAFDPAQVNVASVVAHQARPVSVTLADVNGDAIPDLVLSFPASQLRLNRAAKKLRVTGWLTNGRLFAGEDSVTVVPSTLDQPASCRQ